MRIATTMTGTSPLVQHNVRLARYDDDFAKAISKITAKRSKMTEDDRGEVARLEFAGGLYIDGGGPYEPTANIRKCLIQAAKIRRLGTAVERALIPIGVKAYLDYAGPRDVDGLWASARHRYSTMVGIAKAKTPRMRPQFPEWSVEAEWELLTDALDFDDLQMIVEAAGLVEGLGDNRRNGYGRFRGSVNALDDIAVAGARAA